MDSLEPKKLALIRIYQILKTHSDYDHPLTQEDISNYLERDYGIMVERKTISRNLSLLKEAGFDIESKQVTPDKCLDEAKVATVVEFDGNEFLGRTRRGFCHADRS